MKKKKSKTLPLIAMPPKKINKKKNLSQILIKLNILLLFLIKKPQKHLPQVLPPPTSHYVIKN